ncbi:MAG: HIRAN domain-containing protein [Methanobacteriaceae archaeon]|nr:HIRAN domain-containing protein [Methanobacteriaceae archaeon]
MNYEDDKDVFITINAFNRFHGIKPFKIGSILKLVKEPENDYDLEAIAVELRFAGKSGYVANSVNTVIKGTMSGGRVYDKILDEDFAQVKFISNDSVIAKILRSEEIEELRKDPDNDLNFL